MTKSKGIAGGTAIVLIALIAAIAFAGLQLSATGPGGETEVKDATLNIAAEELDSATKVSTTAYATLEDGTVVSQSLSSGQFTAWTDTFTNKDSATIRAFDSSYYPISKQVSFDGSTTLNSVLDVAPIASASDVSIDLRETSGSSDNDGTVNVAAGGQATVSSVRAEVDIQDLYWNTGMVMFDKPDNSNVTIDMPQAEEVAVPDSAPSGVDSAYMAYNPAEGEDSFEEFAVHDSSRVTISGDDTNDPAESVTVYVDDVQAYESSDTGEIQYGVEDGDGNGLGLAAQSATLTVN